ncbi:MAG: hypothetical protein RL142_727, partial [Actinomycetota bacterium]
MTPEALSALLVAILSQLESEGKISGSLP